MDDTLKTRVIEYFNVETWLLFAHPLSKFLATRLIPVGLLFTSKVQIWTFWYILLSCESPIISYNS